MLHAKQRNETIGCYTNPHGDAGPYFYIEMNKNITDDTISDTFFRNLAGNIYSDSIYEGF